MNACLHSTFAEAALPLAAEEDADLLATLEILHSTADEAQDSASEMASEYGKVHGKSILQNGHLAAAARALSEDKERTQLVCSFNNCRTMKDISALAPALRGMPQLQKLQIDCR